MRSEVKCETLISLALPVRFAFTSLLIRWAVLFCHAFPSCIAKDQSIGGTLSYARTSRPRVRERLFSLNELHQEFHYNVGILAGVYNDTEKLVNWSPVGGNVKWWITYGKDYGELPVSRNSIAGYMSRKNATTSSTSQAVAITPTWGAWCCLPGVRCPGVCVTFSSL